MEISKSDFVSEMFGDLWDIFWHHHWCLKLYLDHPWDNLLFEQNE